MRESKEIDVYICKVDMDYIHANYDELFASLYEQRQEKVASLRFEKTKYISLMAGLLMQTILAADLGIEAKELELSFNENGKPYLKEYPEYFFNLSHSGEYVVFACSDCPLGVDIEKIKGERKTVSNERVARRCFCAKEQAYIQNGNPDDFAVAERFYRIWTMKESYLKCKGCGISVPLNSFCVDPIEFCVKETNEHFWEFRMADYILSICSPEAIAVRYHEYDLAKNQIQAL